MKYEDTRTRCTARPQYTSWSNALLPPHGNDCQYGRIEYPTSPPPLPNDRGYFDEVDDHLPGLKQYAQDTRKPNQDEPVPLQFLLDALHSKEEKTCIL